MTLIVNKDKVRKTVDINQVDGTKYYGVIMHDDAAKCMLVDTPIGVILLYDDLEVLQDYSLKKTVVDVIKELVDCDAQVFEFEDKAEIRKWLGVK